MLTLLTLCNIGIFGPEAVSTEMTVSDFDNIAAVNYRGVWLCAREEAKYMKDQTPLPTHDGRKGYRGSIINIASDLGYSTESGRSKCPAGETRGDFLTLPIAAYCSTKAAVIHMTKCDAVDVRFSSILSTCVLIINSLRNTTSGSTALRLAWWSL